MKKLIFTLIVCLPILGIAQESEGVISFTETTKIEINLKGGSFDAEQLKSLMPSSTTHKKELIFNAKHSIYRNSSKEEDQEDETFDSGEGLNIKIMKGSNENQLYADHVNQKNVEKKDFMGRLFLISGDNEKRNWKIGTETKQIAGFDCQKATLQHDSTEIVAWFSSQIPVSSGPSGYGNLPGMILEVDMDNGKRIITAENIEFTDQYTSDIRPPKKGKAVTAKQFKNIVKEKMEEMGENRGGGAFIQVIERN